MTAALSTLAALACPAAMGIGLCAAAANRRRRKSPAPASLEQLRGEHDRLGERIGALETDQTHHVS
jgi:hypothetical protein